MEPVRDVVDILMSTYNGEKYLAAQIDSILAQTYPYWLLFIRDDGSRDSTKQLIRDYQNKDHRIIPVEDDHGNLGYARSFACLMGISTAPYVMFCDQDDVWNASKIETSLHCLQIQEKENPGLPVLVHTDLTVCDPDLAVVAPSKWKQMRWKPERYVTTPERLMVVQMVSGNTSIFNARARAAALPMPGDIKSHDLWVALKTLVRGGKVHNLHESTILYRRHALTASSSGRNTDFKYIVKTLMKWKRIRHSWCKEYRMAKAAGIQTGHLNFMWHKMLYLAQKYV